MMEGLAILKSDLPYLMILYRVVLSHEEGGKCLQVPKVGYFFKWMKWWQISLSAWLRDLTC